MLAIINNQHEQFKKANFIASDALNLFLKWILLHWVLHRTQSMDHVSSFYHFGNAALVQYTVINHELKIIIVPPLDGKASRKVRKY